MRSPATILVVDDNEMVRFNVTHLLEVEGFRLLEAGTGGEALLLAAAEQPDLILLDVVLPDIHGVELCMKLKADPATSHLFVVLVSEIEVSSESQASGLEAGADGYIPRPIENRELLARVQSMLRIQQAEAALREARDELEQRVIERTAELSRANDSLRSLSQRVVEMQEAERRAVARELHDEIGQLLTGLKMFLETSLRPADALQQAILDDARSQLNELMERVRQLSVSLRPQILDDLGLLTALEWHFKRYEKQTGIHVRFQHSSICGRLPSPIETAAFRIIQEALTNVARHAAVKEVAVRLWNHDGRLGLQIEDRGVGFDTRRALASHLSSGLGGMQERAEMLAGEITIDSRAGAGTRVTVELPLAPVTMAPVDPIANV
ncbi:MAG: hypothetical protein QOF48_2636 [Verrucomicrobiota bacterium]|jgi:signal transduction histidine kinase